MVPWTFQQLKQSGFLHIWDLELCHNSPTILQPPKNLATYRWPGYGVTTISYKEMV